jgi:hypothetical protein
MKLDFYDKKLLLIISKLAKYFPQIKTKPFFLSFATKIKNPNLKKANRQDHFEGKRLQIIKFLDVSPNFHYKSVIYIIFFIRKSVKFMILKIHHISKTFWPLISI